LDMFTVSGSLSVAGMLADMVSSDQRRSDSKYRVQQWHW
jgi:hypothetical protein